MASSIVVDQTTVAAPSIIFLTGVLLLVWRLIRRPLAWQSSLVSTNKVADANLQDLAIIIPARNEALNLPDLLNSLKPALSLGCRVLVVDDQSTDATAKVAEGFGVEVYQTSSKPEGWSGKNWACAEGFKYLKENNFQGQYFLFTDADTVHDVSQFDHLLNFFENEKADLLTARPYHRNLKYWERLLGPFHLLVLVITNAMQSRPGPQRFFSIGQFLLFRKDYYESSGGHHAVKSELAEDLALGKICFNSNHTFIIYPGDQLYSTRMYATFKEFILGWQRNFRLGMKHSSLQTFVETVLVIAATMGTWTWGSYILTVLAFLLFQGKQGRFTILGALCYPFSLILFILISLSASMNTMRKKHFKNHS